MKSYGTMRHSLGAWSLGSHVAPIFSCLPLLWRGSWLPLLLLFCLPLFLVWPGLGARELDQQVAPVLGVGSRRGPRHLWRSAFTLQISPDRLKGTHHEIKEMLYSCNFDKGNCIFVLCWTLQITKLTLGRVFGDWRTNRCKATRTVPVIYRQYRKVCCCYLGYLHS